MADILKDKQPLIVIKRVKKVYHRQHGGAWKIAFADFVTAMMAFFLLMWLLSALNHYKLEGIAEYFKKPLSEVFAYPSKDPHGQDRVLPKEKQLLREAEKSKLKALADQVNYQIDADPSLAQFKEQIKVDLLSDGLRIQMIDLEKHPMFSEGSASLKPEAEVVLSKLAKQFNTLPNKVLISGHTDAVPFFNGQRDYGNWELSVDRANATRRTLVASGLSGSKILRIVGLADTLPLDKRNPISPLNRRIAIMLLNDEENDGSDP